MMVINLHSNRLSPSAQNQDRLPLRNFSPNRYLPDLAFARHLGHSIVSPKFEGSNVLCLTDSTATLSFRYIRSVNCRLGLSKKRVSEYSL